MTNIKKKNNPAYEIVVQADSLQWQHHLQKDFLDFQAETTKVITIVLQTLCADFSYIEISVALADDSLLHKLNKRYRDQDKPTNVLSFGYGKQAFNQGIFGDLYISYERVYQESLQQKKKFTDHYIHLIIHGILHLLGYDHEKETDAKKMEALEINFLEILGIPNPYT